MSKSLKGCKRLSSPVSVKRWAIAELHRRGIYKANFCVSDVQIAALLGLVPPTKRALDEAYLARDKNSQCPVQKSGKEKHQKYVAESDRFLNSYEWRALRMQALKLHGARCQCCGASAKTGAQIHVDHIKPRKLFPQFALTLDNLQVLCAVCNHGKGNWDHTDWRPSEAEQEEQDRQAAFLREVIAKAAS